MKKQFSLLLALVMGLGMLFTGCGSQDSDKSTSSTVASVTTAAAASTEEKIEEVVLNWDFPTFGGDFTDIQKINDELNKITTEKIHATVKLNPIPYADYETKMNVKVVSGSENMDIAWTGFCWSPDVNAAKGAFVAIDDLLNSTPDLLASMPKSIWEASKYEGKIYAVPGNQIMASRQGVSIQKRWLDKFNFDVSTIKSIKDLEPLLEQIKKSDPNVVPFGVYNNGSFLTPDWFPGNFVTSQGPAYRKDDPTCKLFNYFETPEYKAHCDLMRSWYLKGYIPEDTALAKLEDVVKTGKVAVTTNVTLKPGGEISDKAGNGGFDVVYVPFNQPVLNSPKVTMNAIIKGSKNPERALKFLEIFNVDAQIFNLISNGIEGTNYTKTDDKYIKTIDKSGYTPGQDWVFGNQFLGFLKEGMAADVWEQTKKVNEEAIIPTLNGIPYSDANVKTQATNINAVCTKYTIALSGGATDTAKILPQFINDLKKAGIDKVMADAQTQVDAWLANKK